MTSFICRIIYASCVGTILVALVLAASMLVSSNAESAEPPRTYLTTSPAFDSAGKAAIAALVLVADQRVKIERGGAILETFGRFYYTDAVTGTNDSLEMAIMKPLGYSVVATYHTHPPAEDQEISAQDKRLANGFHLLCFVLMERTGTVMFYDPGDAKAWGPKQIYIVHHSLGE
jgi:hypothetical protein